MVGCGPIGPIGDDQALPADPDDESVGGLALNALGESFRADGVESTVIEVVDLAVRRIRLDLDSDPAPAPQTLSIIRISFRDPSALGDNSQGRDAR